MCIGSSFGAFKSEDSQDTTKQAGPNLSRKRFNGDGKTTMMSNGKRNSEKHRNTSKHTFDNMQTCAPADLCFLSNMHGGE